MMAVITTGLSACGKKEAENSSRLDARVADNAAHPASPGEENSSGDARSEGGVNRTTGKPLSPAQARAEALRLAGGKLMETPPASKFVTSTKEPITLGGKASGRQGGACAPARIGYAMDWGDRMPATFPVYPGGTVIEAAGADNAPCNIRAVSFTTMVPAKEVMDFYYTMARRNGYSVEHAEENGGDVLGGTRDRDEGAFYISIDPVQGGGTAVDLIANGGR